MFYDKINEILTGSGWRFLVDSYGVGYFRHGPKTSDCTEVLFDEVALQLDLYEDLNALDGYEGVYEMLDVVIQARKAEIIEMLNSYLAMEV